MRVQPTFRLAQVPQPVSRSMPTCGSQAVRSRLQDPNLHHSWYTTVQGRERCSRLAYLPHPTILLFTVWPQETYLDHCTCTL